MKFWAVLIGGFIMAIWMGKKFIAPHIEIFARAIMEFEGWAPGSVSERNNNPGNLKFANQRGVTGKDEMGHAIFGTFEQGWNALITQLKISFNGTSRYYGPTDTLYTFFSKYAQANSKQYAVFVAEKLGVDPNTELRFIT